ncbi:MAG: molybdopterin dinucleotide binding domain-containing protein [Planctomycetaceae bacterium]
MSSRTFLLNAARTSQQGVQINVGKDGDEYQAIVNTLTLHPDDMAELGLNTGDSVRVSTEFGSAEFQCESGKVPEGMIVVPYGPPTCRLMGGDTEGTGMPMSKGWEVTVEKI